MRLTIFFLFLFNPFFYVFAQDDTRSTKPNIILIIADDMGYGDLGSYGQQHFATPNLDSLAKKGMRFTQFYAGAAVCRPSRATLITGLHTGHSRARANKIDNLRPEDVTIAEVLKKGGYATAAIGKWALGEEGSTGVPTAQGFDYFYGYLNQAHAHNYYPEYLIRNTTRIPLKNVVPNPGKHGQGMASEKVEYSNDLFTEEALDYIRENADKPFFLYLPYTLPHANNDIGEMGMEVPDSGVYKQKDWPASQIGYAGMMTRLDSYIGSIMAELKAQQIDKNTIILFSADNGPHEASGFDPHFFDSNGPFRGIKRELYEGGIRVPFIASGPGIPENQVSDHISYFPDILPTVAAFAGVAAPEKIDGISFAPVLTGNGEPKKHTYLYWEFHERGGSRAIRQGNWKSVRKPFNGEIALYDLSIDPGEANDIAEKHPEIVRQHLKWMENARTSLPFQEELALYLKRNKISQTKFFAIVGAIVGSILLVLGYILFRKR